MLIPDSSGLGNLTTRDSVFCHCPDDRADRRQILIFDRNKIGLSSRRGEFKCGLGLLGHDSTFQVKIRSFLIVPLLYLLFQVKSTVKVNRSSFSFAWLTGRWPSLVSARTVTRFHDLALDSPRGPKLSGGPTRLRPV